jgi:hypothetical protein
MKKSCLGVLLCLLPGLLLAQSGIIQGRISDAKTGDPLPGANIILEGTPLGAASDANGLYKITSVEPGRYTLTVSVIGFEKGTRQITVTAGKTLTVNFDLTPTVMELGALEVLASRATRQTPVAYTDLSKQSIVQQLGSRDIPMVLTTTPSVYATEQGGGAGDSRVNIRGFNQRNVAIMINGVPVNDMENGWVYWSNWDGVADATSSIQVQRGLSAVNLAAPSVGGTMNILTDPTALKRGGLFKQEFGSGNFKKTTLSYHTGLINDKFAASATIVRKTGDGVIDKTWTDAWAYYLGLSYAANANNRFEFFALGAPQRHGQMRYAQNIAAYSHKLAREIFDQSVLDSAAAYPNTSKDVFYKFPEAGRTYNENWNVVDKAYKGKQYYYMYGATTTERHDPAYLNENENYYHKPQINLNWYWTINEKMRLSSIFYFSGGSGGGSGTFGDIYWTNPGASVIGPNGNPLPSRIADWNKTISINQDTLNRKGKLKPAGEAVGFLRNSVNRQWTVGAISKLNYDFTENLKTQIGIDWRTARITHFREVRDLLGGDYAVNGAYSNSLTGDSRYTKFYNEFKPATIDANKVGLGDKIDYNNTNSVDWLGVFAQAEYRKDRYSLYGMTGYSMVKYGLIDHFKKAENHPADYVTATDKGELQIVADWISAFQFKTGGLYKVLENLDVFANFGYVEKVPILDNVIDDVEITLAPDPANEKFISTELGMNFRALADKLAAKINLYNTNWKDRNLVKAVTSGQGTSGDTDLIFLTGLDQTHKGFELEMAYRPIQLVRLDAAVAIGEWKYGNDATGEYKFIDLDSTAHYTYAVKGLMVGDSPQSIYSFTLTLYPLKGLSLAGTFNYYDRFWADWDPASREVVSGATPDRTQSWRVPAYSKIDLHLNYDLPFNLHGVRFALFCHVFNATDALYIADAIDNSQYNAFTADGKNHKANDAEVFVGMPRRINFGLNIAF